MVGQGETITTGASDGCDCGTKMKFEVLRSNAGYYIGTTCRNKTCEYYLQPNSRESEYYRTEALAQKALDTGGWIPR